MSDGYYHGISFSGYPMNIYTAGATAYSPTNKTIVIYGNNVAWNNVIIIVEYTKTTN
jgi:hypothetical protein